MTARAYVALGRTDDALAAFDAVLDRNPDHAEAARWQKKALQGANAPQ